MIHVAPLQSWKQTQRRCSVVYLEWSRQHSELGCCGGCFTFWFSDLPWKRIVWSVPLRCAHWHTFLGLTLTSSVLLGVVNSWHTGCGVGILRSLVMWLVLLIICLASSCLKKILRASVTLIGAEDFCGQAVCYMADLEGRALSCWSKMTKEPSHIVSSGSVAQCSFKGPEGSPSQQDPRIAVASLTIFWNINHFMQDPGQSETPTCAKQTLTAWTQCSLGFGMEPHLWFPLRQPMAVSVWWWGRSGAHW